MIRWAKYFFFGLGGLVVVALAVYAWMWWWAFHAITAEPRVYRYRLTLTVDTPEGERVGSNVIEVRYDFPGGIARAQGFALWTRINGEATIVNLGSRGLLFALLVSDRERGHHSVVRPYSIGLEAFPRFQFRCDTEDRSSSTDEFACFVDEVVRRRPRGELSIDAMPLLVRFRNTNEPTSVERVDPSNLAASFGVGVALKSAYVEITDNPVTRNIVRFLPWLAKSDLAPPLFSPSETPLYLKDTPQVETLNYDDFRSFIR